MQTKNEAKSKESTEDSYASMPRLLQLAERIKEESNDKPELIKAEEISNDKNENTIANIARSIKAPEEKTRSKSIFRFSLCNRKGVWTDYLGLLDTGNTSSLISKDLVDKYEMGLVNDNRIWHTNTGSFKTKQKAIASKI